ncbi:SMP-30/gluconolactonase/LRE family protein [Celeribacter litoreus]|uniref:hypothetical protein n=1 Tax=Celeribacter litoreus TaxID=2876714 RepID=UPI001CCECD63|nr:hypothetical protein [Celeribacter litoreus]MCA0043356.1 hypothetical protein [Celeribacter litoreus]
MISLVRNKLDSFLGRGAFSTSVPVMDGPLQPNHALDRAEGLLTANKVDNLVDLGGALFFSSGVTLLRALESTADQVATYDAEISCLASDGQSALAVGLEGQGVVLRGGAYDGKKIETLGGAKLGCATAALFESPDLLLIAVGSARFAPSEWKRDLMALGSTGSVWRIDLSTGTETCLGRGLAFPYGIAKRDDGAVVVSEAWRHRLVALTGGKPVPVLENLPGYPARIAPAAHGGFWTSLFAPRNQLVEFVLREPRYRRDMIDQVDSDFWIAPALQSGESYREPLQGGSVKQMGILKPWAPAFSYGLVVRLDEDFQPVASWHSRADGTRHGVTALCEADGRLAVAAKGAGEILLLEEITITGEAV